MLEAEVEIHALLPGTGDGVGKIAFDKRAFTYRINTWPATPPLFLFIREQGVDIKDCLKTFNWGVGYYIYAPESQVEKIMALGRISGYELLDIGILEDGDRKIIFEPEKLELLPPGE